MHRETPPPKSMSGRPVSAENLEISKGLKADAGEWYRVKEFDRPATAYAFANRINKGQAGGFTPAGAFEAKSRSIQGKGVLYARFVGESDN